MEIISTAPLMKDKIRTDKICVNCKIHTLQVLTIDGFKCKECSTIQKEE